jgi:adenylate cyclase
MPAKPADLWGYATGRIGARVARAGAGVRDAIDRFQTLVGSDGPDFAAEGLLTGAIDRDARERLLRELHAAGVPMSEMRDAIQRDRLALLPVEGVLRGDGEYTLEQLSAESGLEERKLAERFSALGLGRAEASSTFNGDALGAACALAELEEAGLPEASIDELCRLSGSRVTNIARGVREVFREAFVDPEASEGELGLRYAAAARRMLPVFEPLLRFTLTMSLLTLVRSDVVGHAERIHNSLPGGHEVAVCFADLAGFTRLAETRPPEDVTGVIKRFEALVQEHTPESARHVKTIGDGAMIITDEAALAVQAAERLIAAAEEIADGFPPIHAGVAYGVAITSGGDWYGEPVNLASRLAECSSPGEIYATEKVTQGVEGPFSSAGTRRLSGVEEAVPVFVRPPGGLRS